VCVGSNNAAAAVDAALVEDLVAANHILVNQGVLDGFGHVSMRDPRNPQHLLLSRSMAPALTTAADILEYDLDCNAIDDRGRSGFLERFIHGSIYRARPDINAVAHSHSPNVIPFGLTGRPLQAMFHNAAFIARGVPIFDISEKFGATDMLVGNNPKGDALSDVLADKDVVLMRAHGSVATGPDLQTAVFRAVYTELNARMQVTATMLGGNIAALSPEEGRLADEVNRNAGFRAWDLWKSRVGF
jgi:HCOMODA/2-hydroxy-3-carboxy-muconic semialdehyde decarboxylase